jgi:hypothetical protein
MKGVELYARVRFAVQIEGVSRREAARRFGIDPRTVAKMLAFSVPPGTGGAGRRRVRSWIRLSGSSTGSWRQMKLGRESSGTPRSGFSNGFATSTATLAGSPSSRTTCWRAVCGIAKYSCRCGTILAMRRWILARRWRRSPGSSARSTLRPAMLLLRRFLFAPGHHDRIRTINGGTGLTDSSMRGGSGGIGLGRGGRDHVSAVRVIALNHRITRHQGC